AENQTEARLRVEVRPSRVIAQDLPGLAQPSQSYAPLRLRKRCLRPLLERCRAPPAPPARQHHQQNNPYLSHCWFGGAAPLGRSQPPGRLSGPPERGDKG